jgi:uncharacterized membrane-anchored protein
MMALRRVVDRIPRPVLFALAALIQVALIAVMVIDRVAILRTGTDVTLQTRPVDPRDFLRGDYVVLSYDISNVATGTLRDGTMWRRGQPVLVKLAPESNGFYRAVSLHLAPIEVAPPEILVRGRVTGPCVWMSRGACDRVQVNYGIESYFVPEGEGREIEKVRNQGKVAVVAAVAPSGRAAIKRLLIDGKPVYDEPWF